MKPWEKYQQSNSDNEEPKKPWERYSSKEPDITPNNIDLPSTDKPINIDIAEPHPTSSTSDIVKPEDGNATSETSIDLTDPNKALDNPQYLTEKQKSYTNTKRQQEAINSGDEIKEWTDTNGKKHMAGPIGLEDESLEVIPIGKLSIVSNPVKQNMIYDDVVNAMVNTGKHSTGLEAALKFATAGGHTTREEILNRVANVPPEDKVAAIMFNTDNKAFLGNVKEVLSDDILAHKTQNDILNRKDILLSLGQNAEDLKRVSNQWSEMLNIASQESPRYSIGNISNDLDYINTLYGTQSGKAATVVNKLKLAYENGGTISLGEALDLRKNINRLMSKAAKGTDELTHLGNIKDTLNSFIDNATANNPELGKLIKDTTEAYGRTANNVKLTAFINKNTSKSGAVDYKKLAEDIKLSGKKSPEISKALEIASKFEDKFTLDKHLSSAIVAKGAKPDGLGYIGVGTIARWVLDNLTPYNRIIDRSRFKNLAIQKEISNTISKSNSLDDFVSKIKSNSKVPNELADSLDDTIQKAKDNIKLLEYKPEAKTTGDINLNPKYATENGTVADNMTEPVIKERSDELIKDFVSKANSKLPDNVVEKASKILENKRLSNIVSQVSKKMKVDDEKANIDMLQKIVTSESKNLIKEINRQVGVKLPSEEADKIIKLKLKELMEECNG